MSDNFETRRQLCGKHVSLEKCGFQAAYAQQVINQFNIRNIVEGGVKVGEYVYDAKTRSVVPKNEGSDKMMDVKSSYNGVVKIPVCGGNKLIATVYFGDTPVQIAVYNANNMSDKIFGMRYMSTNGAVRRLVTDVNTGKWRLATTSVPEHVNAFFCILKYYEMMYYMFGRVGITGASHACVSFVDVMMTNAFWSGFCMVFGNAKDSGGRALPLTAMDVCGHELSHGLQTFTTEFVYQGESGALNESIADVFGVFLEFYVNSPIDVPDWQMGEQFHMVIRDMSQPSRYRQPEYYHGRNWWTSSEDQGGVHTNSGVTNYLCYLTVHGKTFTNERGETFDLSPPSGFTYVEYIKHLYNVLVSQELDVRCSLKDFANAMYGEIAHSNSAVGAHVLKCLEAVGLRDSSLVEEGDGDGSATDPNTPDQGQTDPPCSSDCDTGETPSPPSDDKCYPLNFETFKNLEFGFHHVAMTDKPVSKLQMKVEGGFKKLCCLTIWKVDGDEKSYDEVVTKKFPEYIVPMAEFEKDDFEVPFQSGSHRLVILVNGVLSRFIKISGCYE